MVTTGDSRPCWDGYNKWFRTLLGWLQQVIRDPVGMVITGDSGPCCDGYNR